MSINTISLSLKPARVCPILWFVFSVALLLNMAVTPVTASVVARARSDLNGDGVVNVSDLSIIAVAFGSYPGHAQWDSRADVSDDDHVDMFDLLLVVKDYDARDYDARAQTTEKNKLLIAWGKIDKIMDTEDERRFIADNFDWLNIGYERGSETYLQRIKQLNPDIKILCYIDAVAKSSNIFDPNVIKEEWYLHDINGERVMRKTWNFYVMDVGAPGWREYWAQRAVEIMREYSYFDGVFADDVWPNLYEPNFVDKPSIAQSVKDSWYSNMKEFLRYAKQQLGDYYLIANTGDNGALIDVIDGKWDENFVHARWQNYGNFPSVSSWINKVNAINSHCENGKIMLVSGGCYELEHSTDWVNAHQTELTNLLGFCFCSYLLGASGTDSAFNFGTFWNRDGSNGYYSVFDDADQLGAPIDDFDNFGSVYAREFENGKVLVNPTTSSYTVILDKQLRTLNNEIVTSLSLQPHSGMILFEI